MQFNKKVFLPHLLHKLYRLLHAFKALLRSACYASAYFTKIPQLSKSIKCIAIAFTLVFSFNASSFAASKAIYYYYDQGLPTNTIAYWSSQDYVSIFYNPDGTQNPPMTQYVKDYNIVDYYSKALINVTVPGSITGAKIGSPIPGCAWVAGGGVDSTGTYLRMCVSYRGFVAVDEGCYNAYPITQPISGNRIVGLTNWRGMFTSYFYFDGPNSGTTSHYVYPPQAFLQDVEMKVPGVYQPQSQTESSSDADGTTQADSVYNQIDNMQSLPTVPSDTGGRNSYGYAYLFYSTDCPYGTSSSNPNCYNNPYVKPPDYTKDPNQNCYYAKEFYRNGCAAEETCLCNIDSNGAPQTDGDQTTKAFPCTANFMPNMNNSAMQGVTLSQSTLSCFSCNAPARATFEACATNVNKGNKDAITAASSSDNNSYEQGLVKSMYGPGYYACLYIVSMVGSKIEISSLQRIGCVKSPINTGPRPFPRIAQAGTNLDVSAYPATQLFQLYAAVRPFRSKATTPVYPTCNGGAAELGEQARGTFFKPKIVLDYGSQEIVETFAENIPSSNTTADMVTLYGATQMSTSTSQTSQTQAAEGTTPNIVSEWNNVMPTVLTYSSFNKSCGVEQVATPQVAEICTRIEYNPNSSSAQYVAYQIDILSTQVSGQSCAGAEAAGSLINIGYTPRPPLKYTWDNPSAINSPVTLDLVSFVQNNTTPVMSVTVDPSTIPTTPSDYHSDLAPMSVNLSPTTYNYTNQTVYAGTPCGYLFTYPFCIASQACMNLEYIPPDTKNQSSNCTTQNCEIYNQLAPTCQEMVYCSPSTTSTSGCQASNAAANSINLTEPISYYQQNIQWIDDLCITQGIEIATEDNSNLYGAYGDPYYDNVIAFTGYSDGTPKKSFHTYNNASDGYANILPMPSNYDFDSDSTNQIPNVVIPYIQTQPYNGGQSTIAQAYFPSSCNSACQAGSIVIRQKTLREMNWCYGSDTGGIQSSSSSPWNPNLPNGQVGTGAKTDVGQLVDVYLPLACELVEFIAIGGGGPGTSSYQYQSNQDGGNSSPGTGGAGISGIINANTTLTEDFVRILIGRGSGTSEIDNSVVQCNGIKYGYPGTNVSWLVSFGPYQTASMVIPSTMNTCTIPGESASSCTQNLYGIAGAGFSSSLTCGNNAHYYGNNGYNMTPSGTPWMSSIAQTGDPYNIYTGVSSYDYMYGLTAAPSVATPFLGIGPMGISAPWYKSFTNSAGSGNSLSQDQQNQIGLYTNTSHQGSKTPNSWLPPVGSPTDPYGIFVGFGGWYSPPVLVNPANCQLAGGSAVFGVEISATQCNAWIPPSGGCSTNSNGVGQTGSAWTAQEVTTTDSNGKTTTALPSSVQTQENKAKLNGYPVTMSPIIYGAGGCLINNGAISNGGPGISYLNPARVRTNSDGTYQFDSNGAKQLTTNVGARDAGCLSMCPRANIVTTLNGTEYVCDYGGYFVSSSGIPTPLSKYGNEVPIGTIAQPTHCVSSEDGSVLTAGSMIGIATCASGTAGVTANNRLFGFCSTNPSSLSTYRKEFITNAEKYFTGTGTVCPEAGTCNALIQGVSPNIQTSTLLLDTNVIRVCGEGGRWALTTGTGASNFQTIVNTDSYIANNSSVGNTSIPNNETVFTILNDSLSGGGGIDYACPYIDPDMIAYDPEYSFNAYWPRTGANRFATKGQCKKGYAPYTNNSPKRYCSWTGQWRGEVNGQGACIYVCPEAVDAENYISWPSPSTYSNPHVNPQCLDGPANVLVNGVEQVITTQYSLPTGTTASQFARQCIVPAASNPWNNLSVGPETVGDMAPYWSETPTGAKCIPMLFTGSCDQTREVCYNPAQNGQISEGVCEQGYIYSVNGVQTLPPYKEVQNDEAYDTTSDTILLMPDSSTSYCTFNANYNNTSKENSEDLNNYLPFTPLSTVPPSNINLTCSVGTEVYNITYNVGSGYGEGTQMVDQISGSSNNVSINSISSEIPQIAQTLISSVISDTGIAYAQYCTLQTDDPMYDNMVTQMAINNACSSFCYSQSANSTVFVPCGEPTVGYSRCITVCQSDPVGYCYSSVTGFEELVEDEGCPEDQAYYVANTQQCLNKGVPLSLQGLKDAGLNSSDYRVGHYCDSVTFSAGGDNSANQYISIPASAPQFGGQYNAANKSCQKPQDCYLNGVTPIKHEQQYWIAIADSTSTNPAYQFSSSSTKGTATCTPAQQVPTTSSTSGDDEIYEYTWAANNLYFAEVYCYNGTLFLTNQAGPFSYQQNNNITCGMSDPTLPQQITQLVYADSEAIESATGMTITNLDYANYYIDSTNPISTYGQMPKFSTYVQPTDNPPSAGSLASLCPSYSQECIKKYYLCLTYAYSVEQGLWPSQEEQGFYSAIQAGYLTSSQWVNIDSHLNKQQAADLDTDTMDHLAGEALTQSDFSTYQKAGNAVTALFQMSQTDRQTMLITASTGFNLSSADITNINNCVKGTQYQ